MAQPTKIEWTEYSWNPTTGCTKISIGCQHCYAERMAKRLKAMGNNRYKDGFEVTIHEDLFDRPLRWRTPKVIFVNSMSDLFHEDVPDDAIIRIFETMNKCPQHTFQILTRRSDRLRQISKMLKWTHNIWMGVTVESNDFVFRISDLLGSDARTKFASFEPLLGPINVDLIGDIDWMIVGGESGPKAREMKKEWVLPIRDYCIEKEVPYFFKQWGGARKKKLGRKIDGKIWDEMPTPSSEVVYGGAI
jgi:protein gp37